MDLITLYLMLVLMLYFCKCWDLSSEFRMMGAGHIYMELALCSWPILPIYGFRVSESEF